MIMENGYIVLMISEKLPQNIYYMLNEYRRNMSADFLQITKMKKHLQNFMILMIIQILPTLLN